MSDENPYQSPTAPVLLDNEFPRRWTVGLLFLVALQILLSALYLPTAFTLANEGDISPLTLLLFLFSVLTLLLGGITLLAKARIATYIFIASALIALLVLLSWRYNLVFTCVAIATISSLVSAKKARFGTKV